MDKRSRDDNNSDDVMIAADAAMVCVCSVSYTHLTLPTILRV